jgi:DNA-directed RNA polymerase specialized sigma24 family protein
MGETKPVMTQQEQRAALQRAANAAKAHDAKGMLQALFESGALDGLFRRLRSQWRRLPEDDIDFAIAEAVDVVYQNVTDRKPVYNLLTLLWKVAYRRACDYHEARKKEWPTDPNAPCFQNLPDTRTGSEESEGVAPEEADEEDSARRRSRALAIARSLLPRLGQTNVQRVMAYIFDAVEADRRDVPNEEIGDALGLSPDTVRASKSRGFNRLQRIAQEEGLAASGFEPEAIVPQDDGETEAEAVK